MRLWLVEDVGRGTGDHGDGVVAISVSMLLSPLRAQCT